MKRGQSGDRSPRGRSARAENWLPKIVVEALLIALSILLAFAVNQWQEARSHQELAHQALVNFQREVRENMARVEDRMPYRRGLRDVIARMVRGSDVFTAADFHATIGSQAFRPTFLTETAWETALATDALSYMDYDIVYGLSFTYSRQERSTELSRMGRPALLRGALIPPEQMPAAMRGAVDYLDDVIQNESELHAAYEQMLDLLNRQLTGEPADSSATIP